MALATTPMPWKIPEHTLDQAHWIAYSPEAGLCIIPEDEMKEIKMYDVRQKFEGTDANHQYFFGWVMGEALVETTDGPLTIQFTDIVKIHIP